MIAWPSGKIHSSTCGLIVSRRDARVLGQPGHVDLVVEVADVADDRLVLHPAMCSTVMMSLLPVAVMKMSAVSTHVLERGDLVALHRRLQRADRVDLGDDHPGALAAQRLGAALADVAVAAHDGDLAADHHVGGAVDAVDQRVAAAVHVVELRLGHRVVDVDRREQQRALLGHLVEAVHAGRGLLGDALDVRPAIVVQRLGSSRSGAAQQLEDDRVLLASRRRRIRHRAGPLELDALVHQQRGVAAVVEDHVRAPAVRPAQGICSVHHQYSSSVSPFQANTGTPDGACGVPSGPTTIAAAAWSWVEKMLQRGPAHLGAERDERLDQHRGLDRHVQRAR